MRRCTAQMAMLVLLFMQNEFKVIVQLVGHDLLVPYNPNFHTTRVWFSPDVFIIRGCLLVHVQLHTFIHHLFHKMLSAHNCHDN